MKFLTFLPFLFFVQSIYSQRNTPPKLVVSIVVDQMCYDYLYRFYDKYSEKGFKKIMNYGFNARNTHYNYVPTYTGPGHASIYTGTTPSNHGIVANDWYLRTSETSTNCVDDTRYQSVGSEGSVGEKSPSNLKVLTITDQLKLQNKNSKVISVSLKDRSAILPGGHNSDGSYWFDDKTGKFVTSSYYKNELPKWVNDFNNSGKFETYYTENYWNTLLPINQYTESLPDDSPYEVLLGKKTSPTFPYHMGDDISKESFFLTPFANTHLLDFALKSMEKEGLGKDENPDMLCISFSSTDYVGHAFGPYSVEIEDMYLRLDLEFARLIKELDKNIGKNNYVLMLTADHAVVPVPQMLIDQKLPGGYFYYDDAINQIKKHFNITYGNELIKKVINGNVYLDNSFFENNPEKRKVVIKYIKDELYKNPEIKKIFSSDELLNVNSQDRDLIMVSKGYFRELSGDLIIVLNSGYLLKSRKTENSNKGTSHGNLFTYDTHVPLLFLGKSVPKIDLNRRVEITDITPTLSMILNLTLPSGSTGEVIKELFDK